VHRPLGEQRQNGGADISAPTAATAAAAATWAASASTEAGAAEAGAESGAAEATAEAGSETAAKTAVERTVAARGVLVDGVAEFASGGTPLFVDGATVDG
jgi:hypothetical protein